MELKIKKAIAAILFVLSVPTGAFAALQQELQVSPKKAEISLEPGQKQKQSLTVANNGKNAYRLKIYVKDYRLSENGEIQLYEASPVNAVKWIIPQYTEIALKPLETKTIGYIVTPPKDMAAGGHYAAIVFEPLDASGKGTGQIFGQLVLLTSMADGATAGMQVQNFSAGALQGSEPIKIGLTLKNIGNTHVDAFGNIVFTNWLGKQIARFDLGQMLVYPQSERHFEYKWSNHPQFGFYKASAEVSNSFQAGKTKTVNFWFFIIPFSPYSTAAISLAIIALIVVFIAWIARRKSSANKKYYLARRIN